MTTPGWRILYDKVAPALALLCLVIAIGAAVGTVVNDRANQRQDREQLATNTANAVTACENANESRAASRALWGFILDLSAVKNADATPQEQAYAAEFRGWVNQIYQPHNCEHLEQEYPLPPPPSIPAAVE